VVSGVLVPALTPAAAWSVLEQVLDPEVPVLSVVELGIVRDVTVYGGTVTVTVTPTYSGCPATEMIRDTIVAALRTAGAERVDVRVQLAPAWTTDWIAPAAADKLRRYGIAPPGPASGNVQGQDIVLRYMPQGRASHQAAPALDCPRCGSSHTERLSAFGSTACKALYRCLACKEPFEHFKPF
jgi:ring-1,2-phenylacetyl-CoA epoxidase subunit PaaD